MCRDGLHNKLIRVSCDWQMNEWAYMDETKRIVGSLTAESENDKKSKRKQACTNEFKIQIIK